MQISKIGCTNFGYSLDYELVKADPEAFYNMDMAGKLNVLYDSFQKAGEERKILAKNQKNIHSLIDTLGFLSVDSVNSWNGLSKPYKVSSL